MQPDDEGQFQSEAPSRQFKHLTSSLLAPPTHLSSSQRTSHMHADPGPEESD